MPKRLSPSMGRAASHRDRPTLVTSCIRNGLVHIDVEKSAYHQVSQTEIGSDKPCSRHLSRFALPQGVSLSPLVIAEPAGQLEPQMLDASSFLGLDFIILGWNNSTMLTHKRTIESRGRKWKVWVVDETDVTITVRVRPLRIMTPVEFTFPFRNEFNSFGTLAAEAVDRYLKL